MESLHFSGRPEREPSGLFGRQRMRVAVDEQRHRALARGVRSSEAPPPPLTLEEIRMIASHWRRGGEADDRDRKVADALDAVADLRMGALGPKPPKKTVTQRISELMGL
jgi:hypothetical protein